MACHLWLPACVVGGRSGDLPRAHLIQLVAWPALSAADLAICRERT
jgi:hypothetical protein